MPSPSFKILPLVAASSLVAACGGGGGAGAVASAPTPVPLPNPTVPLIFPAVTASTDFATLGYESPAGPTAPSSLIGTGFTVRYDASSNAYVMDVPGSVAGVFQVSTTGERYWNGQLRDPSGGLQPVYLNVFRPGPQNWDFSGLSYTSFAEYSAPSASGDMAFGLATPASGIPVTGSATYNAFAAGYIEGSAEDFAIRGSVLLSFNFGAGTLAGSFDPYVYDLLSGDTPLGHYEFVSTVFGVGSQTFSGELARSGLTERGSFNGQFTGPNAQELMARWTAPLFDNATNTTTPMFGVWVGKCC